MATFRLDPDLAKRLGVFAKKSKTSQVFLVERALEMAFDVWRREGLSLFAGAK